MSTTAQSESAKTSPDRRLSACKPLIDAATIDLFRQNAFCITGLPVDASTREVDRHAGKLKMLAEFGHDPHTRGKDFALTPPPSLDDIRDAIQKIKDPERRLIDEFFWFWPAEFGKSRADPAFQALANGDSVKALEIWISNEKPDNGDVVAIHNMAIAYQFYAFDSEAICLKSGLAPEQRAKTNEYWNEVFKRWRLLENDEKFWAIVSARIRQLNEPNLPTGFTRRMRATLPMALDKINAALAVGFAESGNIDVARIHIGFLHGSEERQGRIEKIAELILTPAGNRLKEQIKSARARGEKTPSQAATIAVELLQESQKAVILFDLFFEKNSEVRNDLFDEVAATCNRLQVIYHEATQDEKTCLEILHSALPMAAAIELKQQIQKNISTLEGFIADKKIASVYTLLKSIQDSNESPSARLTTFKRDAVVEITRITGISGFSQNHGYLSAPSGDFKELFDSAAIVLRGISLDAWNNHQDLKTAVDANKLAIIHAASAELKQKLAEDKSILDQHSIQYLDGGPFVPRPQFKTRAGERSGLFPQFGQRPNRETKAEGENSSFHPGKVVLGIVGILIVLGIIGSCNSPNDSPHSTTYDSHTPSTATYAPPAQSAPTYTPQAASESGISGNNVYQVPNNISAELDREKTGIEADRAALKQMDDDVEALGREIENDRIYLDKTSQYAVDAFNTKVDRYNTLSQQDKDATSAFNQRVDSYNAKLRQHSQ